MIGSERYFPFSFVIYTFITPERCEYPNTICEVLVYNFRVVLVEVERLFVVITFILVLNDP